MGNDQSTRTSPSRCESHMNNSQFNACNEPSELRRRSGSDRNEGWTALCVELDEPDGESDGEASSCVETEVEKYMSNRLKKLFLTCEVCYNTFDLLERAPKSLNCQHTFCLACLMIIHQRSNRRDKAISCPKCRTMFKWEGELQNVPNDHKIVKLIDFLSENAKGNKNVCVAHGLRPLKKFCITCDVPVCNDCITLNHQGSGAHRIVDAKSAMEPKVNKAVEIVKKAENLLSRLEVRKSCLFDMLGNINTMKEISEEEIDEIFENLRKDLETRRIQLREMLQEKSTTKKTMIIERRKQLCDIRDIYQRQVVELASATRSKDFTRICSLLKSSEQLHEAVEPIAGFDDVDVEPHLAFNIPVNVRIVMEMKTIGDIEEREVTEDESERFQIERSKIEQACVVARKYAQL